MDVFLKMDVFFFKNNSLDCIANTDALFYSTFQILQRKNNVFPFQIPGVGIGILSVIWW